MAESTKSRLAALRIFGNHQLVKIFEEKRTNFRCFDRFLKRKCLVGNFSEYCQNHREI